MKKLILPVFISVLFFACRQEPASEITGQTGTDSLPPHTEDTATWHKSNPGLGRIINLYFPTAAKGLCAAQTGIYSTIDSGKTWQVIDTSNGQGNDVYFLDQQHGYFISATGFGSTTDGGNTWEIIQIKIPGKLHVLFTKPLTGYITTTSKGLLKTTDGGKTWKVIGTEGCDGGIYFINEQKGLLSTSCKLLETEDGSLSYSLIFFRPSFHSYTISFADSLHGWLHNSGNYILRTTNGGSTWDSLYIGKQPSDIQFINNKVGYIPTVYDVSKSTDGGETWNTILQAESGKGLVEVFFLTEDLGWVGNTDVNIYRWSK